MRIFVPKNAKTNPLRHTVGKFVTVTAINNGLPYLVDSDNGNVFNPDGLPTICPTCQRQYFFDFTIRIFKCLCIVS